MVSQKKAATAVLLAGAGFAYGVVLAFLAVLMAGSGHGLYVPMGVVCSPACIFGVYPAIFVTPVFWAVVGVVVSLEGRLWRICSVLLLAAHYGGAALDLLAPWKPFSEYQDYTEGRMPSITLGVMTLVIYVLGQIAVWMQFTAAARRTNPV